MEEKMKFSKFITQKRTEANLTQKELAEKLFVSNTAISKWERGLSYPDITLVLKICEVLNITEHEFFTACDDFSAEQEKKQAKRYRNFVRAIPMSLNVIYGISILICFICNLAIDHTLSWFFIVLVSVALAFSITSLPIMLKKNKIIITFVTATFLIYLLELVCYIYVSGDWLLSIAYPITTVSIVWVWFIMLIIKYFRLNASIKVGLISLVLAVGSVSINTYCDYALGEEITKISSYFNLRDWNVEIIGNKIVFFSFWFIGVIGLMLGIIKWVKVKKYS